MNILNNQCIKLWDISLDGRIWDVSMNKQVGNRFLESVTFQFHARMLSSGLTVIKKLWTFFGTWGRDRPQSPSCWIFRVKQILWSAVTSPETVLNGSSVKTKLCNTPPTYFIVLASSVTTIEYNNPRPRWGRQSYANTTTFYGWTSK